MSSFVAGAKTEGGRITCESPYEAPGKTLKPNFFFLLVGGTYPKAMLG